MSPSTSHPAGSIHLPQPPAWGLTHFAHKPNLRAPYTHACSVLLSSRAHRRPPHAARQVVARKAARHARHLIGRVCWGCGAAEHSEAHLATCPLFNTSPLCATSSSKTTSTRCGGHRGVRLPCPLWVLALGALLTPHTHTHWVLRGCGVCGADASECGRACLHQRNPNRSSTVWGAQHTRGCWLKDGGSAHIVNGQLPASATP